MNMNAPAKRPYRQSARAQAAQETGERIVAAFAVRLRDSWFDEIRLEDLASDAGVTVQTVIRRFGGKEGLLDAAKLQIGQEIMRTRAAPRGDIAATAQAMVEDYEMSGDVVIRALAQEDRYPAMKRLTDFGRAWHRGWLAEVYASWLEPLEPEAARRRLDALVVATDVYVWKLLRRDMRRPAQEYRVLVETLIASALAEPPPHGAPQCPPPASPAAS